MTHREPAFLEIRPRTRRLGIAVHHVHEAPSTQAVARRLAEEGARDGLVVVADRQTEGVGRLGRTWAGVGASLYATLILRPARGGGPLTWLPLAAGVAAAEAAERLTKGRVDLKWPNDLLVEGRKLGGVLVDAVYRGRDAPEFVLVGLGVNGDAREEDFPVELRDAATSLSRVAGHHVCLPALLKVWLERLEPRVDEVLAGHTQPVWRDARRRLGTIGRRVRVRTPEGEVTGDAVDLGPEGELLVRVGNEVRAIRSGECEELRAAPA